MDIYAIVSQVLESNDIVLTAYQIQNLLAIIDELPSIEKRALEMVDFDEEYETSSITGIAIEKLRNNEVFASVAQLGTMSHATLIDILTALTTGHEDDFGYWKNVEEDEEKADVQPPIDTDQSCYTNDFLYSPIRYGKPNPDHDSYYVDDTEAPFAPAYIKLLQTKGISIEDPTVVWLHLDCRHFIETKFRPTTVIGLLMAFKSCDKNTLAADDKKAYDKIKDFFEYWLHLLGGYWQMLE